MIKINSGASGRIKLTPPYSLEVVARLRTVRTRRWHPDRKYWSFEYSKAVLDGILFTLAGEELDIDPSLGMAALQEPCTTKGLLERARHLIRLKHYSIRTEESYLPWIERYILFHNNRDLDRKYPNAGVEWAWQSVFPARKLSTDPRTGVVRRHHVHERSLQKAVRDAARLAGIPRQVNAHALRQATMTCQQR